MKKLSIILACAMVALTACTKSNGIQLPQGAIEGLFTINDNGDQVYSIYSSKTLGKIGEYDGINHLDRGGYKIVRNEEDYWLLDRYYNRVFDDPYEELEEAYYIDGVFVVHNGVKQLWG